MATKKTTTRTQPVAPATYKNSAVSVEAPADDPKQFAAAVARKLTRPEVCAASVIEQWQKDTHDVNQLVAELAGQVAAVNGGDLTRAEGMLIAQAHTLDNIFANLARRATGQEYLKHWEAYMRMAMKAQNQCRMTLETLAAIKNPPVVFARQANINNGGQQQVNNGMQPAPASMSAGASMAGCTQESGAQSLPAPDSRIELDPRRKNEQVLGRVGLEDSI